MRGTGFVLVTGGAGERGEAGVFEALQSEGVFSTLFCTIWTALEDETDVDVGAGVGVRQGCGRCGEKEEKKQKSGGGGDPHLGARSRGSCYGKRWLHEVRKMMRLNEERALFCVCVW